MSELVTSLNTLRRPRLLISAARFGLADYRRERDLRRLTQAGALPPPDRALSILLTQEENIEATRRNGDAAYSVAQHIEILVAMMCEARLLPRSQAVSS